MAKVTPWKVAEPGLLPRSARLQPRCARGTSNQEARTGTERESHLESLASGLPPATVPESTRSHQREASSPHAQTGQRRPQPGLFLPSAHRVCLNSATLVLPHFLPPGDPIFPRSARPSAFPSATREEGRLRLKPLEKPLCLVNCLRSFTKSQKISGLRLPRRVPTK